MGMFYEKVKAHFATRDIPFIEDDQETLIIFFPIGIGRVFCLANIDEENNTFIFMSHFPIKASPKQVKALLPVINAFNYSMMIGNWEADPKEGHIRLRTSIASEPEDLTDKQIKRVVGYNLSTYVHQVDEIIEVLFRTHHELSKNRLKVASIH